MSKETTFAHPPKGHVAILAYDSANDQWQAVYVDASGRLQVDIAAAEAIDTHPYGYTGSAWQKLGFVWNYNDEVSELVTETSTGAATTTADGATVPAGEVWVITNAEAYHDDPVSRVLMIQGMPDAGAIKLAEDRTAATNVSLIWGGVIYLKEDSYMRARCTSLANGQDLVFRYCGYKMKVNM